MAEAIIGDIAAREKIKSDLGTNFFVEAGAGSGKTYSLVQRMVSMVESGIPIDKICAITFTNAAAGEFYSRFYSALNSKLKDYQPGDETYRNIEKAIEDFDKCFLGTLDSFCSMVISEHPAEAGVPADSEIIENDELHNLYIREFSKIADGEYGKALKEKYLAFRSLNKNPKSTFSECADFLAEKRTAVTVLCDIDSAENEAEKELKFFRAFPDFIKSSGAVPDTKAKPAKAAAEILEAKSDVLGENIKEKFADINNFISDLSGLRFSESTDLGQYSEYFSLTGKKPQYLTFDRKKITAKLNRYKYAVSLDFVSEAIKDISANLKGRGKLTFFDYKLCLRDMLKEDAKNGCRLISHILDRHSYFLLDEFQDTNPLQYEIVFYIAAGSDAVPEWDRCLPKPGSLFIVGDPKQSIYRFQGADIESFSKVRSLFDSGRAGETLILTKNFRSTSLLGEWFNKTFESRDIFPEKPTKYQCSYSPVPSDEMRKTEGEFSGVFTYRTKARVTEKAVKISDRYSEAENVCNIINKITYNSRYKVASGKNNELREITYGDIMIITREKNNIPGYADMMRERKIPYFSEGRIKFGSCNPLVYVSQLMKVIGDTDDKIALYKILTSEIFGITEDEIYAYVRNGRTKLSISNIKEVRGCGKLKSALEVLASLKSESVNISPAAAFDLIADKTEVCSIGGAEYYECFIQAGELLRDAVSSCKILTLKDAAEFIGTIAADNSDTERCLGFTSTRNAVRIANLHKVKGLEAPVVILASGVRKNKTKSYHISSDDAGKKLYVNSITGSDHTSVIDSGNLYPDEMEEEGRFSYGEYNRLLYVAATRAANVLIVGQLRNEEDDTTIEDSVWYPLSRNITDNDIDGALTGEPKEKGETLSVKASEIYAEGRENSVMSRTSSAEKTYELILPSKEDARHKTKASAEETADDSDGCKTLSDAKAGLDAALLGTLVHGLMEVIVSSKTDIDVEKVSGSLCSLHGADERYLRKLIDAGRTIYSGGYEQSSGFTKNILEYVRSSSVRNVMCEVPFCYFREGRMVNGVMDLVLQDGDSWHIIDYKTDSDKEASYTSHKNQLDEYIKAFREISGQDAKAHIYHIDIR